ncbi:putative spatacsin [Sesbania bispinosa]|nr:putative spatacsin [Sesbania bispinosa]
MRVTVVNESLSNQRCFYSFSQAILKAVSMARNSAKRTLERPRLKVKPINHFPSAPRKIPPHPA